MILGIGTDIVNIARIKNTLEKFGKSFPAKILGKLELAKYTNLRNEKAKARFLSNRFAGKEAVKKASYKELILPYKIQLKEIEILNDNLGKPFVKIEKLSQLFYKNNYKFDISLSDDYPFAIAFVILKKFNQHV